MRFENICPKLGVSPPPIQTGCPNTIFFRRLPACDWSLVADMWHVKLCVVVVVVAVVVVVVVVVIIVVLSNLTATLTAYIFGMKHDIHNRTQQEVSYIVLKVNRELKLIHRRLKTGPSFLTHPP